LGALSPWWPPTFSDYDIDTAVVPWRMLLYVKTRGGYWDSISLAQHSFGLDHDGECHPLVIHACPRHVHGGRCMLVCRY